MFTSVDYVYYSYVSIFEIKDKFLNELKKIGWENPIIEIYDDVPNKSQTLFIAKDQQLYNWHDEKGYNPNQNGESCILLTASLEKKKVNVSIQMNFSTIKGFVFRLVLMYL
ncbi:MAG: hypothetical protein EAZ44_06620 [Cytophagia bacterium]|nr:MAG: hypothetical protein EAZ44_06620 [Cytophagia bacterium]TAG42087.1 MAG: hypothetical protein EAZ31_06835 [Cytophagia bacterium]